WERHDHRDGARQIGLRPYHGRDGWQRGSTRGKSQKLAARKFHGGPPVSHAMVAALFARRRSAPLDVRYGNATHVISIQMTEPVRRRVQVRGGKLRPLAADPAVTPSFSPERRVKFCSKGSKLSQIAFHPLRGGQDVPIRGNYARYRAQLA